MQHFPIGSAFILITKSQDMVSTIKALRWPTYPTEIYSLIDHLIEFMNWLPKQRPLWRNLKKWTPEAENPTNSLIGALLASFEIMHTTIHFDVNMILMSLSTFKSSIVLRITIPSTRFYSWLGKKRELEYGSTCWQWKVSKGS